LQGQANTLVDLKKTAIGWTIPIFSVTNIFVLILIRKIMSYVYLNGLSRFFSIVQTNNPVILE